MDKLSKSSLAKIKKNYMTCVKVVLEKYNIKSESGDPIEVKFYVGYDEKSKKLFKAEGEKKKAVKG